MNKKMANEYVISSIITMLILAYIVSFNSLVTESLAQGSKPLEISNVQTLNETGAPTSEFEKGQVVIVQANVTNKMQPYYYYYYGGQTISFMFIVKIQNPDGETVFYGVSWGKLDPQESGRFAVGYGIPTDAKAGTYTAYIYAWNQWPSEPGVWIEYADPQTTTFTVKP